MNGHRVLRDKIQLESSHFVRKPIILLRSWVPFIAAMEFRIM